jgi:hypothetical protein
MVDVAYACRHDKYVRVFTFVHSLDVPDEVYAALAAVVEPASERRHVHWLL